MIESNDYMTASDAARLLGVTQPYVSQLIAAGELAAMKFGPRTVLIKRTAVEALKQRRARR